MRNPFYLFLLLITPVIVLGQSSTSDTPETRTRRIFIEGSAGVSVPLGQYKKTDPKTNKSGFANTGFLAQITGDWMGKKDLGVALQYTFQSNPISSSSKNDTLPGRFFPLGTGSWTNHYLMLGPVYIKQIKKLTLNAKILGGIVFAVSPLFSYTSPDVNLETVKNYGTGVSFQFAFAAGYSVSSRVSLKLEAGYIGAFPAFKKEFGGEYLETRTVYNEETHKWETFDVYSPIVELDLKNYISTINASAGIIIRL
jgi:hypothetical protein